MRRSLGTVTAALCMAVLVGCSGSGADSGSTDSGGGESVGGPAPGGAGGAPVTDTDEDRQVVTTASASLSVDDPAESAQQVSELVESAGGRIDERTEQAVSGPDVVEGTIADLVVRVPADELTDLLADLEGLGEVESVSVFRSDVTDTAVDLDARISALQTSVARLQALMDQAATVEDLLAAEETLSERQQELESLQSQRALLADQVELSTLSVHLQPFGVAPPGGPDGFLDGLGTGWRALLAAGSGILVVLGVLLPWLVVAAVVTVAVLVPLRMRRRTALAGPAPAGPSGPPAPMPPAGPTPPAPPQA